MIHNPVHHDRTKHVEVDRHFIKENIQKGIMKISYISTTHQVVDILTKALNVPSFDKLKDKLRLYNIYHSA